MFWYGKMHVLKCDFNFVNWWAHLDNFNIMLNFSMYLCVVHSMTVIECNLTENIDFINLNFYSLRTLANDFIPKDRNWTIYKINHTFLDNMSKFRTRYGVVNREKVYDSSNFGRKMVRSIKKSRFILNFTII